MYCISFPQYIYLSLCISVYLFVYISLWPSIFPPHTYLSQNMYIFPSVYICLHLLSFPLYIYLSFSPAFHLSLCLISKRERERAREKYSWVGGQLSKLVTKMLSAASLKTISAVLLPPPDTLERGAEWSEKKTLETMSAGCLFHKIED